MKKKCLLCAAAAGLLMLTGCAKDSDLSARYDDFMKYSFGEDYQFEFVSTNDAVGLDNYKLTFHDHTGKLRTENIDIYPYSKRNATQMDLSKKEYYDTQIEDVMIDCITAICEEEFEAKIMQPCFPSYQSTDNNAGGVLDGATMWIVSMPVLTLWELDKDEFPELRNRLDPQNGWQVCKADLKSIACDPEWSLDIQLSINEGVDPAPLLAQLQEAEKRLLEEVQTPQTLSIYAKQKQDGKTERLFDTYYVLGEKLDAEKCLAKNSYFTALGDARTKIYGKMNS